MYLIAGLGNPGKEYEKTRHNVGFEVLDRVAKEMGIRAESKELRALVGKGLWRGEKVLLVKPQTYMNLSGESIGALADYYKIPAEQVIVISDDVALPVGSLRVRKKGSAGGHNGLKNIILHLGTEDFPRVRVGVGEKNEHQDLATHVLGRPGKEDRACLEEAMDRAALAVLCILESGPGEAMNRFNAKKREEETAKPPAEGRSGQ